MKRSNQIMSKLTKNKKNIKTAKMKKKAETDLSKEELFEILLNYGYSVEKAQKIVEQEHYTAYIDNRDLVESLLDEYGIEELLSYTGRYDIDCLDIDFVAESIQRFNDNFINNDGMIIQIYE